MEDDGMSLRNGAMVLLPHDAVHQRPAVWLCHLALEVAGCMWQRSGRCGPALGAHRHPGRRRVAGPEMAFSLLHAVSVLPLVPRLEPCGELSLPLALAQHGSAVGLGQHRRGLVQAQAAGPCGDVLHGHA